MIGQARRPGADTAVGFEPKTTGHADRSLFAASTAATLRSVTARKADICAAGNRESGTSRGRRGSVSSGCTGQDRWLSRACRGRERLPPGSVTLGRDARDTGRTADVQTSMRQARRACLVKLGWRLHEIASAGEYRYGYADGDWPAQVHLDESVRPSFDTRTVRSVRASSKVTTSTR